MTDLAPLTALGDSAPRDHRTGAFRLSENSGLALASLAVPRGAPVPAPFGLSLPGAGQRVADDAGRSAWWTAPDQWMIAAEGLADTDFAAALAAEAPGARVTEQTGGWVALDLTAGSGTDIAALLERMVNLPAATLAPGCATRTGFEHMSVFLIRPDATHLAVLGMRSLAGSLWHGLETVLNRLAAAQAEGS